MDNIIYLSKRFAMVNIAMVITLAANMMINGKTALGPLIIFIFRV
jgi:hypothetical protein